MTSWRCVGPERGGHRRPSSGRAASRLLTLIAFALALAACGGQASEGTQTETETVAETEAETETVTEMETETETRGGELVRCESPAGWTLAHPESWSTNPGDVVPPCSQLHPEPFEVPEGTDERVAAITAYIDPVAFHEVAAPDEERNAERAATTIDGLQAARLEYEIDGGGLWPEGTPIVLYAVNLSPRAEDEPQTLFLDTVGLESFDYEENRIVLDRVARSLDVTLEDVPTDPSIVARYEGAGGFAVEGRTLNSEACLRIPPDGEPVCTDLPARDQAHTIQLTDLEPILAGVTGSDVFRLTAETRDGEPSTFLPAPIPKSDARGFAFTFDLDELIRLTLYDVDGNELRTIEPGG